MPVENDFICNENVHHCSKTVRGIGYGHTKRYLHCLNGRVSWVVMLRKVLELSPDWMYPETECETDALRPVVE